MYTSSFQFREPQ